MYVAQFPTATWTLEKTPTRDILKLRQATWEPPPPPTHGCASLLLAGLRHATMSVFSRVVLGSTVSTEGGLG